MHLIDQAIEELQDYRGEEAVSMAWLADRLLYFVALHPEFEIPIDRLATWLARLDDPEDEWRGQAKAHDGFSLVSTAHTG